MHHNCLGEPCSGTRSAHLGQTAYGVKDARATIAHWLGRVFVISRQWCGRITARARTRTTVSSGPALSTGYHAPRRSGHCTSRTKRAHRAAIRDPPSCPAPTARLGPRKGTAHSAHSKLKTVVRLARDRTPRSVVQRTFVLHHRRRRIGRRRRVPQRLRSPVAETSAATRRGIPLRASGPHV